MSCSCQSSALIAELKCDFYISVYLILLGTDAAVHLAAISKRHCYDKPFFWLFSLLNLMEYSSSTVHHFSVIQHDFH